VRTCPRCRVQLEDEARFCPDDGTPLQAAPDPYIGKLLYGQFRIREICGRGSMGTVYRAHQTSMDREVALKVLRRDLLRDERVVKRFQREARASARLSHPNIITVYLVGDTDDGVPFLAMEFVHGKSLDEICAESGPLPPVRAIHIARQIASALGEAHGQSIVHRDLKPENILLTNKKHAPDFVKVLDFGIAKILYTNDESMLTQTGAIFGTPYYLSPEQAAGADIDHRCDLYALGVILFRMVTGQLPFRSSSGMAVLIQHLKDPPPAPRDIVKAVPRSLDRLILKMLEKAPGDRFQSAEELGVALDAVVAEIRGESVVRVPASSDGVRKSTTGTAAGVGPLMGTAGAAPPSPALAATATDERVLEPLQRAAASAADDAARPGQLPPTQVQAPAHVPAAIVPASRAAAASDPRFRVPEEHELAASAAVASSRAGAASPPATAEPAVRRATPTPGSTLALSASVGGGHRVLFHALIALGSIVCGTALGAALHWTKGRPARRGADTRVETALGSAELGTPRDQAASPRSADARAVPSVDRKTQPASTPISTPRVAPATQPVAKKAEPRPIAKKAKKKARKVRRPRPDADEGMTVPPVGPGPSVGDHGDSHDQGDHSPRPRAKKKEEPKEIYDMVE
jgi:serine/threonine-protein kinase